MVAPARRIIPAPPVTPLPYTLMSVADVRDGEGRVLFGATYPTDACSIAAEGPEWCPPVVPDPLPSKTPIDGQPYAISVQFPVYSLLRCRLVAGDIAEERATRVLQYNEARAVESGFMNHYLSAPGDGGEMPAAVDLTPVVDTPVCPELGIALLEGYAAQHYAGSPVIHMGRTLASLVAQRNEIIQGRGRLETRLGAYVAAGGGYDLVNLGPGTDPDDTDPEDVIPGVPGEAPPAGATWIYVTGAVTILRGDAVAPGPVPVRTGAGLGNYNNEFDVFAERPYAVLGECIKAAVLVTVDCEEVPAP